MDKRLADLRSCIKIHPQRLRNCMANVDRRHFVQMSAALGALTVLAGGRSAFALGGDDTSDQLVQLGLSEAARRIRARQLTSTELTKAFLQRIEMRCPRQIRGLDRQRPIDQRWRATVCGKPELRRTDTGRQFAAD